ncbi:MAG: Na(+)-translocating NADH-quinone reductase subunit C [Pseudomonadales bacterium]
MSRNKDSLQNTIIVSLLLCLVCSVLVSSAAVILKDRQTANKLLERNTNVLAAAGLLKGGESPSDIDALFTEFKVRLVDVSTGHYLTEDAMAAEGITLDTYDQRRAAKDPKLNILVPGKEDIAVIKRQAKYAAVYILEREGKIESIVLPVHGYGLWSTLYGFLAVEGDGNTVSGLTFYEHAETPGLGGEVDNPKWKAQWPGKHMLDAQGDLALSVVKAKTKVLDDNTVDGLSGATLTTRGIDNLVKFWLGDRGFGSYLANVREGEM